MTFSNKRTMDCLRWTLGKPSAEVLQKVFGEIGSILFTFLISIFRYQKLRDAENGGILPVFLDNIWLAWAVSGLCVMLAMFLGTPTYLMNWMVIWITIRMTEAALQTSSSVPRRTARPLTGSKYIFILLCNLLHLFIVTSCLIVKVLLVQRRVVVPALSAAGAPVEQPPRKKGLYLGIDRNTVGILAAMEVFQVEWILQSLRLPITTSYTTISPYVYGIGSNLFSVKH